MMGDIHIRDISEIEFLGSLVEKGFITSFAHMPCQFSIKML